MFCENCGKELSAEARFCSSCGKPINGELKESNHDIEDSSVQEKEKKASQEQQKTVYVEADKIVETIKEERKADRNANIIVVVIAAIVVIIAALSGAYE